MALRELGDTSAALGSHRELEETLQVNNNNNIWRRKEEIIQPTLMEMNVLKQALSSFLTLFPCWLNRILVTLVLPGLLKHRICWE